MSRFVLTAQLQLQAPNNVSQVVRQIQNQLNGVTVNVQVQGSAQAQRQIQQITNQTNQCTSAATRMGRAFAVSIRRFAAFSIATRAVGLFTSTLSDAVQTAIDFERQLIKVSQVTGKSVSQLSDLTGEITRLSTSLGVSSQSLLDVTTVLAQAGLTADDTKIALNSLAKAALAPNFDSITETAEGAIAILAQFKEGVGALEGQLGSINAVAGAFAVEASDLIDVIRRTGGVFKSSGGSLNELLALFTSVRATTRESAESIGTGLRTIFTRIQRPKTIEYLKRFGVELVDLEGKFVGPYEAVRRLSTALSGLGDGDITFIQIAEELGGFRQIGKVLPLLQQFSTAQAALNVATRAGNSLSSDAASAQAALAIKIMKVKEEFLALVRSITETSTFQVMANTALQLASALIRIADAVKPLLPMLAALAAIRITRGIGSFAGAMMGGLTSGRTFNKGGKVHAFASGGLVPGVGNRDTVPAMLSPGEFVIRKSSVQKLGTGTLHAMNENRYAAGGMVNINRSAYGQAIPAAIYKKAKRQFSTTAWNRMSQGERDQAAASLSNEMSQKPKTSKKDADKLAKERQKTLDKYPGGAFVTRPKSIGGFFLTPEMGTDGRYSLPTDKVFELNGQKAALLQGSTIENYVPFRGDLKNNAAINNIVDLNAQKGISDAVTSASNQIGNLLNTPQISINKNSIQKAASKSASDKQVYSTLGGYMYEGIIQGLTGAKLSGGQIDFDFNSLTSSNKKSLSSFFGVNESQFAGLIKADAKRSLNSKMNNSIFDKVVNSITKGDTRGVKQLGQLRQKKHFGGAIQRFATGGGVGTDTVPALLTPGEFVINRKSAQAIGYGSLNRMNKVGRYAKGGIVQRFAEGGTASMPDARTRYSAGFVGSGGLDPSQNLIPFDMLNTQGKALAQTQQQLTAATQQTRRSMLDVVSSNKMFAASVVTSLIQGFLPAVDENSSALLKMSHGVLGLITTITSVGFALEMFGAKLTTTNIMDFMGGKGISTRSLATMRGGLMDMGLSKGFANGITGATQGLMKMAGPILAVVAGLWAMQKATNTLVNAIYGDASKAKEAAIQKGDITEAGKQARIASDRQTATAGAFGGAGVGTILGGLVGGIVGAFGGPIGTAIGIKVGAFLGASIGAVIAGAMTDTLGKEAANTAMALAANSKASKDLAKSQNDAAIAAEKFRNGTISASEYLNVFSQSSKSVKDSENYSGDVVKQSIEGKSSTFSLRNLGAYLGGGLFGMETSGTRNKRLTQEGVDVVKGQRENEGKLFQDSTEARNAAIRSTIARGGTAEDAKAMVKNKLGLDSEQMKARAASLSQQAESARKAGDTTLAAELDAQSVQLSSQADQLVASFENIEKEVTRAKAAFEALDLGLRGPEATATAMSASLNKFAAGLEVGGNQFVNNTQFLSEAMSSAAQAMNPDEIKSAIKNVKDNLTNMGVSEQYATKFENNANALIQAQQNYTKAFANIKANNPEFKQMSPEQLQKAFADELTAGLDGDVKKNLTAIIEGIKLTPEEVDDILGGNLQVFGDKLGEAGKKQFEQIMQIAQERQKAEKVLIDLTKQRIDAERNYVEAAKQAIDLRLEGRELQGKYGGKQVTMAERRAAIVDKSNAGAKWLRLSQMGGDATVEDFARRRNEIQAGFASIEEKRRQQGGMSGVTGVEMDEKQKELNAAVKDQIQTIRDLVKLEEENLRLVQEKNKLEKQSLESLVNGDIEKFFEQQAAVGATAAIATGNKDLMNAFGGQALGAAYSDIQRQQDAGVQSLYGRQLAGQGGLVEQSATAALGARGITNPLMAQQLAGTTPEEEASRARLRELGGELGNLGELGQQMAEMQVETATMNVKNATIELANIEQRGKEAAAGMSRGGVVYASRGIFVPRGTDTVPAMLTPGEFVVNRNAVNRGNNLQILRAMNGNSSPSAAASVAGGSQALSRGGSVQYLEGGGLLGGLFGGSIPDVISNLSQALGSFVSQMSENIKALQNTKFKVTLDSTNINVNISGLTAGITDQVKEEIAQKVAAKIRNNYSVGQGGKLIENTSTLPKN